MVEVRLLKHADGNPSEITIDVFVRDDNGILVAVKPHKSNKYGVIQHLRTLGDKHGTLEILSVNSFAEHVDQAKLPDKELQELLDLSEVDYRFVGYPSTNSLPHFRPMGAVPLEEGSQGSKELYDSLAKPRALALAQDFISFGHFLLLDLPAYLYTESKAYFRNCKSKLYR